jgi:hypothetical protein
MMKKVFTIALLSLSLAGYAQKIKIVEGSLAPLKGQKSVFAQFTYNDMSIGAKGIPEKDYIAKRKGELNEKEAGRGDKFAESWYTDRKERFEPQFRELFNKYSEMSSVDEKAQYTIIFHTTRTEVGFNVGVASKPAYIDAEVTIVETANPSKVVAKITITKALGYQAMGYDFETGVRLTEAYAKSGKELGKLIVKEAK